MAIIDNRPGTTIKVTNKTPVTPVRTVRDLATGAHFKLKGRTPIFIKTDETLGRGYRCLVVGTGNLEAIVSTEIVEIVYDKVTITIG